MKRLTAIAAALAAGMTSFAACAHEAPRDGGKIMAEALASAKHTTPATKRKAESRKPTTKKIASSITRHGRRIVHKAKGLPGVQVDPMTTASTSAKDDGRPRAGMAASASPAAAGGSAHAYGAIIDRYAKEYGVASSLAHAVIQVESGYNVRKTGRAGEVGLMQIKPSTARMLGYSGSVKQLYSPETNIKWGMKYLGMAQEVGNGTTCGTLLKYNAGHGAKRMNPISAAYCKSVKAELADAAT